MDLDNPFLEKTSDMVPDSCFGVTRKTTRISPGLRPASPISLLVVKSMGPSGINLVLFEFFGSDNEYGGQSSRRKFLPTYRTHPDNEAVELQEWRASIPSQGSASNTERGHGESSHLPSVGAQWSGQSRPSQEQRGSFTSSFTSPRTYPREQQRRNSQQRHPNPIFGPEIWQDGNSHSSMRADVDLRGCWIFMLFVVCQLREFILALDYRPRLACQSRHNLLRGDKTGRDIPARCRRCYFDSFSVGEFPSPIATAGFDFNHEGWDWKWSTIVSLAGKDFIGISLTARRLG